MKAVPLLSFILGAEAEPETYNHDGDSAVSVPIGVVKVPLTGVGYLSIQSTSPEVLIAMSAAFLTAAGRLRGSSARWTWARSPCRRRSSSHRAG